VASASSTSNYANLPLPPTAGGVNTDTIRFMAVGESSYTFDPSPVRIPVQQPITWVNTTTSIINVASEDTTSFDSGPLAPGESFTYTPTLIGSVPYRDKLHPWVRGVLVATNASGR
jgi:plastocyanin